MYIVHHTRAIIGVSWRKAHSHKHTHTHNVSPINAKPVHIRFYHHSSPSNFLVVYLTFYLHPSHLNPPPPPPPFPFPTLCLSVSLSSSFLCSYRTHILATIERICVFRALHSFLFWFWKMPPTIKSVYHFSIASFHVSIYSYMEEAIL